VDAYSTYHAKLLSLLSGKHESQKVYVEREIHQKRFHFVRAFVTQYPENLGKLGDQGAEANHSSYCSRIGKQSNVEPHVQLQHTLGRQVQINNERAAQLYGYHTECMATACALINDVNATEQDRQKAHAILYLSSEGFLKWQKSLEGAKELIKKELPHDDGELQYCEITRRGYENSAPRKICLDLASGQGRCMCVERIADLRQCSHEIKAYDGKFVPALWSGRWTQRDTVSVSYNTPPSTDLPFVANRISNIAQSTPSEPLIANGIDTELDDEQFGFADGGSFDVDLNPGLDNGTDLISGDHDPNEEAVRSGLTTVNSSSANHERFRIMATATDGLINAAMGNAEFKSYVAIVVKLTEIAASNQKFDVTRHLARRAWNWHMRVM
jgi:hypothetical protein